ncbi:MULTISPECIES: hypothetical protein [Enterobacter]|uniref:hypothetical protein n=1 Tax=Enterobacter TaxID=547 RepID=UPI0015EAC4B4|nr:MULTISPECIES: hypothetical protein [Enterobacter]MDK9951559.1 hypothetical protein [Enterobacter ludwigii]QLX98479.1 hypothetical protein HV242_11880 [Enterobacter sp. RHBSTW-00593]HEM8021524.1 hypothetical protein [Enterobacter ludwigii]
MKSKTIHLVLVFASFFIGYFIIKKSLSFIAEGVIIAAPWAVVGLMQLPLSYCIQAIFKTNEVNDHSSLTPSELRRLSPLVKSKRRLMVFLLAFYVFSTLFVVLGLMVSAGNQELLYQVLKVSGGLLFVSFYTSIFVHKIMIELQSFKAILNRRDSNKKERESFLDKLK